MACLESTPSSPALRHRHGHGASSHSADGSQSPAERGRWSPAPGLRHPVPAPQEATGTLIWGRVIKPVSWRIWSSMWVMASCMTWPPRTNSRRTSAMSWRTLAEKKKTARLHFPGGASCIFWAHAYSISWSFLQTPQPHLFCKSRTLSVLVITASSSENSTCPWLLLCQAYTQIHMFTAFAFE